MRLSSFSSRRPAARAVAAALALAASLVAGCGGEKRGADRPNGATKDVGGTVVITVIGNPDILLPPLAVGSQSAQVVSQLFDRLAEVGDALNTVGDAGFTPRLAKRWAWAPDSLSIRFTLNDSARWHDGTPVRSDDVKFSFDVYRDPATGSAITPLIANVDSVTTPDSLTAVAYFHRRTPQQFFDLAYNVYVLPKHLLDSVPRAELQRSAFGRQPVGTGRFRFVRWVPNERLEIMADTTNWRGRPNLDRVVWTFAGDPVSAGTKLLAGEVDVLEALRLDVMGQLKSVPTLRMVEYPSLDLVMLQFNVTRGPFSDAGVRRALAPAIDRAALVKNVYDTLGYPAVTPAPRAFGPSSVTSAFDPAAAGRLLDSLGWHVGADSVRTRNGKPLAFSLLVPTSSQPRVRLAVLLQAALKRVGVRVTIDEVDFPTFAQRLGERHYEAAINSWHGDPTPSSIRQTWSSTSADAGGSGNTTGYVSRTFDARLDSAELEFDGGRRRALYERAYETFANDAPAIFICELRTFAGVHRRVQPTGLRRDGWWVNLADWSIPASERIDRDRIGLRTAAR